MPHTGSITQWSEKSTPLRQATGKFFCCNEISFVAVTYEHAGVAEFIYTKMPAFLIENGFMDFRTDTPKILTNEHAERTAQGILVFLVEDSREFDS